jgi:cell wall-associated NlpC family hydrolase
MTQLKRKTSRRFAAAVVPIGIAAAFAFQASALAAPSVGSGSLASSRLLTPARPHIVLLAAVNEDSRHSHAIPVRMRAYDWAVKQKGHPYVWGGTGPGFDCSGLVMMAYRHAGIHLPRTTYDMLASPLLIRVKHPVTGDLAFYGTGHVELFRRWGYTFGAHDFSSPVSLVHYGWGWKPTAFYRVRLPAHHSKVHERTT